ncbi:N,N-dimethylformamidase beta subunit family domain-containing protein [Microtetraspora fusca]|uniref:N,N-dimethylformamidase beta subunit family domain-containing protein n=1 Tax=Microtetraspora fusca TaxID=1997 RepID=UPI000B038C65|nr:N,N-dimethylformamidase beta subunit family domain-containing protein [Microtetraspora fusca]
MGENDGGRLSRRTFLGVVAAATAGATACGAVTGEGATRAGAAGTPASGPLLLPSQSPSPDPAATTPPTRYERLRPGDPSWRARSYGPAEAIEGYCDQVSVLPGHPVEMRVSTTADRYRVTAYRMGWYGGAEARRVWRSEWLPGRRQGRGDLDGATRTVHANWRRSLTVPTAGWPEGAYLLRLDSANGHQRYVPLIVRSPDATGRTLLVHAAATWQAYNQWGGYSLYYGKDGSYGARSLAVSFDRPYDKNGAEKFLVYERGLVVLAERLGIPLAYTTGLDLTPEVMKGAAAVVFLGHDEYWTPQSRRQVTRARDAGSNIAFLGANTCYRRIRIENGGRLVVCYKDQYARDPMYGRRPAEVTADFRSSPAPDPESSLTGVYYDGFPADAPYVVTAPHHWLFEGTGVRRGDAFPHLVGVEYDRVTPSVPTPRPIEIIAHSPLMCGNRPSFADSAYYTTPSGAGVFATGTMRWVEALRAGYPKGPQLHGMDARTRKFVTRTTTNLLRAFARGPAGEHRTAPRDNVHAFYA